MRLVFALCILIFGIEARADSSQLFLNKTAKVMDLSLGLAAGSVTSPKSSLTGFGPVLNFDYAIEEKWSLGLGLGQFFDSGQNSLFFSVAGGVNYAISGSFVHRNNTLLYKGVSVIEEKVVRKSIFAAGVFAEQVVFNGKDAVYPATGPSLQGSYTFNFWDQHMLGYGKYSMLNARGQALSIMQFGFSVFF